MEFRGIGEIMKHSKFIEQTNRRFRNIIPNNIDLIFDAKGKLLCSSQAILNLFTKEITQAIKNYKSEVRVEGKELVEKHRGYQVYKTNKIIQEVQETDKENWK